jgi:hypothetical protein
VRAAEAVEPIAVEVFRQCEWRRKVDVMAAQARCPQWWSVFSVRGKTGTYVVRVDDVLRETLRCCCGAFKFDDPRIPEELFSGVAQTRVQAAPACR